MELYRTAVSTPFSREPTGERCERDPLIPTTTHGLPAERAWRRDGEARDTVQPAMKWRPPHLDPDFPISRQEYFDLIQAVGRSDPHHSGTAMLSWAVIVCLLVLVFVQQHALLAANRWLGIAFIVVALVIVGLIASRLMSAKTARLVRAELRRRGHEICVGCGYWLRGLGADVLNCPECGAAREPMPKVQKS